MKHEHYQAYKAEDTEHAESALLTVWDVLADFRDDLVLVGGLVPRYLCQTPPSEPQPVTMDVDMGIALSTSSGQYDTIRKRLQDAGFDFKEKRFQKKFGQATLFIDLLTDKPAEGSPDTAMVDDVPVSAVYGLQRALDVHREVTITGRDLYNALIIRQVKVCDVGPFACLKLLAYRGRHHSKDVFDLVRVVRDYKHDGPREAVRLFHAERGHNLAYLIALDMLRSHFDGPESKGPAQYADFCLGAFVADTEDSRFLRSQRINEALEVAGLLLE